MVDFIIDLVNKPFMQWTYIDYIFAGLFWFIVYLIITFIMFIVKKIKG